MLLLLVLLARLNLVFGFDHRPHSRSCCCCCCCRCRYRHRRHRHRHHHGLGHTSRVIIIIIIITKPTNIKNSGKREAKQEETKGRRVKNDKINRSLWMKKTKHITIKTKYTVRQTVAGIPLSASYLIHTVGSWCRSIRCTSTCTCTSTILSVVIWLLKRVLLLLLLFVRCAAQTAKLQTMPCELTYERTTTEWRRRSGKRPK